MSIAIDEIPDSRYFTEDPPSETRRYRSVGEQDNLVVQLTAPFMIPQAVTTSVGILNRQPLELQPNGFGLYVITANFTPRKRAVGEFSFSFDTTGATVKRTTAFAHIGSYPPGDPANPHKGTIGVKRDGSVEGCDVVIPALRLTYTFRHPAAVVNESFARTLARNTGRTNSAVFRDFEIGELLFLGATGEGGSDAVTQVAYHFLASENATGMTFGDIADVAKAGHEYCWIEFQEEVAGGRGATQPLRVHVERVYGSCNFANVFGWS